MDVFDNKQDWLKREKQVNTLIDDFLEPEYIKRAVIGLNSNYGTGKSTFIKMCQKKIESNQETKLKSVYIDISESEFENSPVFTILNAIIRKSVSSPEDKSDEIIRLGKIVLELTSGISFKEFERNSDTFENKLKEILTRDRSTLKKRFEKYLGDIIDTKIVVFLDDIDRCSPFFAIRILEELKSYFKMIDNLIFVVAYDREQLERFIRKKFGDDMDTNGYLIKFFDTNYLFSISEKEFFLNNTKSTCIKYLRIEDNTELLTIIDQVFSTIHSEKKQYKSNTLRSIQQSIYRLIIGLNRVMKNKNIKISEELISTLVILMYLREANWQLYSDLYKGRIDGLEVVYKMVQDKNLQGIDNFYAFKYLLTYNENIYLEKDIKKMISRNIRRCDTYEDKLEFEKINYEKGEFKIQLNDFLKEVESNNYINPQEILMRCLSILEYDEIGENNV